MTQRGKNPEDFPEFTGLESQLREWVPEDPGEAFFSAQREAVLLQIELQDLPATDPGELLFHRQLKAVRRSLRQESGRGFWELWARPLAAAAALFFLVLGLARITHWQDTKLPPGWTLALEQLAEEEYPTLEDIEDLNDRQLWYLAHNLEGSILVEAADQIVEEPVEFEDLNEQELHQLIERLEAKKQT